MTPNHRSKNTSVARNLAWFFIVASLVMCITGCEKRVKRTKFLMGTIVEITAVGNENDCQQAIGLAFDEIKRIDKLMNVYDGESEISQINEAAGKSSISVSADTLEVIERSLKYAQLTDGALDVSVSPIMELWGFGSDSNQVPSDEELAEKLSLVDYRKITVDSGNSAVKLESPGMKIDVSGIAKGYAVDRAAQVMKDSGIRSVLVNAGGDIYAMGSPPKRESWNIGIRHPRNSADLLGVVKLEDKAVATSGDYENFFRADGKRYCHIMNPRTGRPVSGIMSVTIVADNTADVDALATAVFPLGAADGMKLIEQLEGVDGIIVTGKGKNDMAVMLSSGMADIVELRDN